MNLKNLRYQGHATAQGEPAFTLVELVAVLAAVALLGLLALPALAGNKGKSKVMQCLSNMRQIGMGTLLFTEENGYYPPLYIGGLSGTFTLTPDWIVQNGDAIFWPDRLRLGGYVKDPKIFSCPELTWPAMKGIGGGFSTNNALGIGINYPEIGNIWMSFSPGQPYKPTQVTTPSRCIGFADAGSVTSASVSKGPDNWVPDTAFGAVLNQYNGGGSTYFRAPSDFNWTAGDALPVPRHNGRANFLFMDGHAEIRKNSSIGWFLPRTDPGALWARDHTHL